MNDEATASPAPEKKRRRKKTSAAGPPTIRVQYTLAELPSSQHRAGLAGLVVALRYLQRAGFEGLARVVEVSEGGANFEFDPLGMRSLFDIVYAASEEEIASPNRRANREPLRIEERTTIDPKTKKERKQQVFVYPQVVPRGEPLLDVDPTRDGSKGLWTKLWRDSVWGILRGISRQRGPYNARALGKETDDHATAYAALASHTDDGVALTSSLFLGAMEKSAEEVLFRDRAKIQFLLHFWPIVASVYVPETQGRDGRSESWGFAFCIPDVANLEAFVDAWPAAMRARGTEMAGIRPREAIVSLSREGGLAALSRLRSRLAVAEDRVELADLVLGIDVVHAEKPGHAVKICSVARVEPAAPMIDEYERLRGTLWDHAFRRARVENLMEGRRWSFGFDRLLRTLPAERVLGGSFAHDARVELEARAAHTTEETMTETPNELEDILLRIVNGYLARKVRGRTGESWDAAKDDPARNAAYGEAKEKLARTAFLAIRSRTGADFVDYFASTLCSVPQRLKNDEFSALARALRERPAEVRTLTMLALSARS